MKKSQLIALCGLAMFTACGSDYDQYDATGIFEAREILVSAETSGRVEVLDINEGDDVKAGQSLGLIDTLQLHLAKEEILASNEAISSRYVDIDLQLSALRERLSVLRSEYDRFSSLVSTGSVSKKQLDDMNSEINILETQIKAQENALESSNMTISGESKAGFVRLQRINDQIKRSVLKSPITGRIIEKYVDRVELTMQGAPVYKVADVENMYIRAYLTSDQLKSVKVGDKVTVVSDFGDDQINEYEGTLTWISDKSEFTPKTIYTSNERANLVYAVKISFKNDGYAKIGMYGGVKFIR